MRYLHVPLLAGALAAAALLLGMPLGTMPALAADPGVTANEIVIGMWSALTGPLALPGVSESDGIQIGMDEINRAGGIHGRKLRLIVYDDAASPQEGLAAVRRLIEQDRVFALIAGSTTGATQPSMPLISRQRVPFIVSIAAGAKMFDPFPPTSFRVYATDVVQGQLLVDYAITDRHVKKPAMILNSTDYGLSGLDAVSQQFGKSGIKLVASERYNTGDQDFSAQLLRIREAGADSLFAWSFAAEAGIIVRQAHELGLNLPAFGGGATTTALFPKTAGAASVGFAAPWVFPYTEEMTEVPAIAAYRALLSKRYPNGYPPARPSLYDLAGYGALKILAEGLRRIDGEPTREKLVHALETLRNYDTGVLFPVTFTPTDHEGSKQVSIIAVDKSLAWRIIKR